MTDPQASVLETLRGRVLRGLRAGTLEVGSRLPSARDLVAEFGVDHRLILAAYRELAAEGLVEVRERGGVYVAPNGAQGTAFEAVPIAWLVDTFGDALGREIRAAELPELMRRALETVRLRAIVISTTADQVAGLARELREDFGLEATGIAAEDLDPRGDHRRVLASADLLLATEAHAETVGALARETATPMLTIDVRPDLVAGEWAMLLRQPVWAIVATPEFGQMLTRFFAAVRGAENLHIVVHGRDDVGSIPRGAPTYVTARVRESLDLRTVPGRVLPAARTIASHSARAILDVVVRANLRALRAIRESEVRHWIVTEDG